MKAKFTRIMHYATRLVFFLHAQKVPHNYIPLSAKKKYTIVMKKVHEQVAKREWVLQKAMKQGRNGNVGEFQAHDYFIFFNLPSHDQFRLCARLILIQSQRCFKQYYL